MDLESEWNIVILCPLKKINLRRLTSYEYVEIKLEERPQNDNSKAKYHLITRASRGKKILEPC
jgi:hypothetical protein